MKNMVARYDGIKFSKKQFGNVIYKTSMFITDYHLMFNMDYIEEKLPILPHDIYVCPFRKVGK